MLGVALFLTRQFLRKVFCYSNSIQILFVFLSYMVETEIVAQ